MMLVRTFVAPSEIQGLGVFAGEFIPGGSHLWVLNPGSPTERRSAPTHSMIVLTVQGSRITPELLTL